MTERFRALGAHIYAGGFTVGVSKHFDVACHLEHAAYGREVVGLNFPDLPVHAGGPDAWPDPASWPKRGPGRIRFAYANPPCAIWSGASAGRHCSWEDDPRLKVHHDVFDHFLRIGPDVFAMESVTAVFTKGRAHVDALAESAAAEGYSFTSVLHDAQHLGVPQARKRCFLTFHRVEVDWTFPEFGPVTTVREALSKVKLRKPVYETDLNSAAWCGNRNGPKNGWIKLAEVAKPGESLHRVFDRLYPDAPRDARGHVTGRPGFVHRRAPLDAPSNVIMADNTIHPTEMRVLHQDEISALCGFPREWKWPTGLKYDDVGGFASRGVMPPVGEWLAADVARAIERGKRLNRPKSWVLDVSRAPGALSELERVLERGEEDAAE